MSKRKSFVLILGVAILAAFGLLLARAGRVVAPGLLPPEEKNLPTSVYSPLTQRDEIQIYAAVILHLRRGPTYILRTTDDRGGSHDATQINAMVLSPTTQAGINVALSDLSPGIVWLDNFSDVERDPMENGGRLKDLGSVITLGNLKSSGATSVRLVAKVYRGSVDGAGYSYTVQKLNGVWTITEAHITYVS